MASSLKIGTCSWNYDSWVGLVYSHKCSRSAEYLSDYARHFDTVEIDSWFYKPPSPSEVEEYLERAGAELTFSCKLFQGVTLTHLRPTKTEKTVRINPDFFSAELYDRFIDALTPMLSRIEAIELEFEYLNRDKMPSLDIFLNKLDNFFATIDRTFPLAVETRNSNYLHREYFSLLKERNIAHVFSEKLYMPHIYDVYGKFSDLLSETVFIRLLGGDRVEIEKRTGNKWDTIVDEKPDLPQVAEMVQDLAQQGRKVRIYVNNHYEGSAVKTIEKLKRLLDT